MCKSGRCRVCQMTDEEMVKTMMAAFIQALSAEQVCEGPHFADDDETLACLELDLLSPAERQAIREHIAACSHCRSEFCAMIRAGVVTIPASWEKDAETAPQG